MIKLLTTILLSLVVGVANAGYLVKLPPQAKVPSNAKVFNSGIMLVEDPTGFEILDEDKRVYPTYVPNDTYIDYQWHFPTINGYESLDIATGNGVIVAVLDTGIDPKHEDLYPSLIAGWNVWDNNNITEDVYGHGTDVAGIIAATTNNALGVAGIAPNAKIIPIRISAEGGYSYLSKMVEGIEWAIEHGAKVINLSYGGACTATMDAASDYAAANGAVVVFSAGNDGVDMECGIDLDTMVVVSATGQSNTIMGWSSYGTHIDITAPGSWIYTTLRYNRYSAKSGTSFSAPMITAVLALIYEKNPNISSADAIKQLKSTAVPMGEPQYYGSGMVDAYAASNGVTTTTTTTAPSTTTTTTLPVTTTTTSLTTTTTTTTPITTTTTTLPGKRWGWYKKDRK